MKRSRISELLAWKDSVNRLPLILKGARQVGKTYLVRDFAAGNFPAMHEFNFETQRSLHQIFSNDLDINRIMMDLSFAAKAVIGESDLIFFDEVQECPAALTALKYFAELLPAQPVIAAGSLLGLTLGESSFPVGKVSYLWLGPMTFEEFLNGLADYQGLDALKLAQTNRLTSLVAHEHLWNQLKLFYVTGGLPRVVTTVASEESGTLIQKMVKIREIQEALVRDYQSDFSKHTEKVNAMHIRAVFNNIPSQLSRREFDNSEKYKFSKVIPGKATGYAQLQAPIEWLERAGLVYRIKIANHAGHPLSAHTKDNLFKLFLFDAGIFGALAQTPPQRLIADDYGTAKGYFAEAIALEGLVLDDLHLPYAWMEGDAEIEFILELNGEIVPIEVKSSHNTKAKSLASYINRYAPKAAIKLYNGLPSYNPSRKLHSLPLYLAWDLRKMDLV